MNMINNADLLACLACGAKVVGVVIAFLHYRYVLPERIKMRMSHLTAFRESFT